MQGLRETGAQGAAKRFANLLLLVAVGNGGISAALTGLVGYIALRIPVAGQYPYPGILGMRGTQLRKGRQAVIIALVGLTLAVVVLLGGLGVSAFFLGLSTRPSGGETIRRVMLLCDGGVY